MNHPRLLLLLSAFLLLSSCSVSKKIERAAREKVLNDPALRAAHVGICIYDPSTGKYLYNFQGDKYFVPASNTKIPTCYAAMKYLGDSLVGLRYAVRGGELILQGTGDPTLLHPDYKYHPVYEFIRRAATIATLRFASSNWQDAHWGSGWSWTDYEEAYMAERSPLPIYGNTVKFNMQNGALTAQPRSFQSALYKGSVVSDSFYLKRWLGENRFDLVATRFRFNEAEMPFRTMGYATALQLLNDTIHSAGALKETAMAFPVHFDIVHSQPTDSVLRPMMHRSDNFFAEQCLLMVGNQLTGVMNDRKIIDSLLRSDFKDLPQKPQWVDGCGLSRFNLFTPQDFVFLLNKMRTEFSMDRIQNIFATGNTGTLLNYYKAEQGSLFAKTGTLSGVVALSGFLYTKENKLLIFSVLVNNHQSSAPAVRRAIEKFIEGLR